MTNCERALLALALADECLAQEAAFLKEHLILCETCRLAESKIRSLVSAAQEAVFPPEEALTRNLRERILSKLPAKIISPWWIFQPGWGAALLVLLAFGVFWHRGTRSERELPLRADVEMVERLDFLSDMEILENLEVLEKN